MKHLATAQFFKQLLSFFLFVIEGVLLLRVFLKLLAANPDARFVSWVYEGTYVLVYQFMGMFPSEVPGLGHVEIEFSTIFAMFIYGIIGFAVLYFIGLLEKPKKKW